MSAIYLDNHSTTAVDPRVLDIMLPFFSERFGNAASLNHVFGQDAADAVTTAREQIARLLNTSSKSLVFTSGATEANNLAIKGLMTRVAGRNKNASGHLITNAAEHRSVLDPARKLQRAGFGVTILPVNHLGQVDPQQVASAIRPDTVLVSVMLANNEVGTLNPVAEIGDLCHKKDVLFHCDAVQALGRIPIDLACLPIDLLSISAHKCYGPMGVGALFVRRGAPRVQLDPLFDGGGHENRMRSGTLPVPLVVGFGACCELASGCFDAESLAIAELRDRLWNGLQSELDGVVMNGHATNRLAGNLNVSFAGVDGDALMTGLKGLAVSSGSACTTAEPEPSHVLRAIGLSDQLTRASLRFGIGRFNTANEIDQAIDIVAQAVRRLRNLKSNV